MTSNQRNSDQEKHTFLWDEEAIGYRVYTAGVEIAFHQGKSLFDRNDAFVAAKKQVALLRAEDRKAEDAIRQAEYQWRPLRELEQEWVMLQKKLDRTIQQKLPEDHPDYFTAKDLARYQRISDPRIIRSSLIEGSHPALKD